MDDTGARFGLDPETDSESRGRESERGVPYELARESACDSGSEPSGGTGSVSMIVLDMVKHSV